jgi:hypothetical protein
MQQFRCTVHRPGFFRPVAWLDPVGFYRERDGLGWVGRIPSVFCCRGQAGNSLDKKQMAAEAAICGVVVLRGSITCASGDRAQLLHHSECIPVVPAFANFSMTQSRYCDTGE